MGTEGNFVEQQLGQLCYSAQSAAIMKVRENKLNIAEMRMLGWMCGKKVEEIRNEYIIVVGVAQIKGKVV